MTVGLPFQQVASLCQMIRWLVVFLLLRCGGGLFVCLFLLFWGFDWCCFFCLECLLFISSAPTWLSSAVNQRKNKRGSIPFWPWIWSVSILNFKSVKSPTLKPILFSPLNSPVLMTDGLILSNFSSQVLGPVMQDTNSIW